MEAKTPEVFTVAEVADYLRCSTNTIYRLLKANQFPGFRMGSDWRFNREQIDLWRVNQQTLPWHVASSNKNRVKARSTASDRS